MLSGKRTVSVLQGPEMKGPEKMKRNQPISEQRLSSSPEKLSGFGSSYPAIFFRGAPRRHGHQ
jgi:hypothetical protein